MNIHCSACGAPLPQKFCRSRILPLSSMTMIKVESPDKLQNRITAVSLSTDPGNASKAAQ